MKSNEGDPVWKDFFVQISKQFAIMESIHLFDTLNDKEKLQRYSVKLSGSPENIESCVKAKKISSKLKVIKKLEAFSGSLKVIDERLDQEPNLGYALLKIDTIKKEVYSALFTEERNEDAESAYTETEKAHAKSDGMVVALVSSSAVGGIKEAYPNYFADSSEFVKYLYFVLNVKF